MSHYVFFALPTNGLVYVRNDARYWASQTKLPDFGASIYVDAIRLQFKKLVYLFGEFVQDVNLSLFLVLLSASSLHHWCGRHFLTNFESLWHRCKSTAYTIIN